MMRTTREPLVPGAAWALLALGLALLAGAGLLLRFSRVTDHLYHALVKDPERTPPPGRVLVAPADGSVIYVKRVEAGVAPEIVKRGVPVPLTRHLKTDSEAALGSGWLVGIYMNSDGVHVNRVPIAGRVVEQILWNGPHMDMSPAERTIILSQLVPGWVGLRRWLGLPAFAIEEQADFVLGSARETLVLRDARQRDVFVTRIADYAVGRILTWVGVGEPVATGQRLGMITWGSQTDVFFQDSPGLVIEARVGTFVYGGETVLARY